jgi:hypothetical protein
VTPVASPAEPPGATQASADRRRRALLVAGVGAAAGLVGVGTALWMKREPTGAVPPTLWTTRLARAGGG